MKKWLIWMAAAVALVSCETKYNYHDTGVSEQYFPGNMYEYLHSNSYDWDSIVKIIDRAGLKEMFEKEEFTFVGPTNITVRKWFYWDRKDGMSGTDKGYVIHGYKSIKQVPVDLCRKIVYSHVIDKIVLRDLVARATYDETQKITDGGDFLTTRWGNRLWFWTDKEPYMGIDDMGPVILSMASLDKYDKKLKDIGIASVDIRPTNGVVHSLPYSYNFGDMFEEKDWVKNY